VDAVTDVKDLVLGIGDLAREHPGGAGPGFVLLAFRRRELVAALGARGIASGDDRVTVGAFLGRNTLSHSKSQVFHGDYDTASSARWRIG